MKRTPPETPSSKAKERKRERDRFRERGFHARERTGNDPREAFKPSYDSRIARPRRYRSGSPKSKNKIACLDEGLRSIESIESNEPSLWGQPLAENKGTIGYTVQQYYLPPVAPVRTTKPRPLAKRDPSSHGYTVKHRGMKRARTSHTPRRKAAPDSYTRWQRLAIPGYTINPSTHQPWPFRSVRRFVATAKRHGQQLVSITHC